MIHTQSSSVLTLDTHQISHPLKSIESILLALVLPCHMKGNRKHPIRQVTMQLQKGKSQITTCYEGEQTKQ